MRFRQALGIGARTSTLSVSVQVLVEVELLAILDCETFATTLASAAAAAEVAEQELLDGLREFAPETVDASMDWHGAVPRSALASVGIAIDELAIELAERAEALARSRRRPGQPAGPQSFPGRWLPRCSLESRVGGQRDGDRCQGVGICPDRGPGQAAPPRSIHCLAALLRMRSSSSSPRLVPHLWSVDDDLRVTADFFLGCFVCQARTHLDGTDDRGHGGRSVAPGRPPSTTWPSGKPDEPPRTLTTHRVRIRVARRQTAPWAQNITGPARPATPPCTTHVHIHRVPPPGSR